LGVSSSGGSADRWTRDQQLQILIASYQVAHEEAGRTKHTAQTWSSLCLAINAALVVLLASIEGLPRMFIYAAAGLAVGVNVYWYFINCRGAGHVNYWHARIHEIERDLGLARDYLDLDLVERGGTVDFDGRATCFELARRQRMSYRRTANLVPIALTIFWFVTAIVVAVLPNTSVS
jgi:hypothetical protein